MEIAGESPASEWNKVATPPYASFLGSVDHVIQSSLGAFDSSHYFGNPMTKYIYPLFLFMIFCQCILLLNMLIAIMSDIFLKNNVVAESTKRIQQLEFVVDNWWIDPIKDKQNIVYLVAAVSMDVENDDNERFDEINAKIDKLNSKNEIVLKEINNI